MGAPRGTRTAVTSRMERDDRSRDADDDDTRSATDQAESHATTGGAAAAGAVTGGIIGLTGGPLGAALGAVGGAIVGAAAERMMHSEDEAEHDQESVPGDESDEKLDSTAAGVRPSRDTKE